MFLKEQYLALIALGFGAGAYGTLIGAGGGFVLMPILLLLYPGENPEILASISLAVVFFNALSGSEAYASMKRIDFKSGLLFATATIPGAILGALTTSHTPRRLFDAIIAVLMIAVSIYLLSKKDMMNEPPKSQKKHRFTRHLVEKDGTVYTYSFNPVAGVSLSFFLGYMSGMLGIGGGIFYVPILVYLLHFPVHIATATSQFCLAVLGFTGTLTHITTGTFTHGVHRTVSLAIGVVLGAQLGAHLSAHIKVKWIIKSLAFALLLIGIRILIAAFQS